jgi:hypothetical protein
MIEYNTYTDDCLEELLDLSGKLSHTLHEIMLIARSGNLTKEQIDLLAHHSEVAIVAYHRIKACSYSILGIENRNSHIN